MLLPFSLTTFTEFSTIELGEKQAPIHSTLFFSTYSKHIYYLNLLIPATLLNPDMSNPNFRLNRTDWKVPVTSYTYNSYMHNLDFA